MAVVGYVACALGARRAAAQSAGQIGAWDGLMLSPVGALTPVAHDPGEVSAGAREISLRYGRWHYDADDAVHDNFGVTWTYHFGFARSQLSLTAAYGLTECPTCSGWVMGGVELQSGLWSHSVATTWGRPATLGVEVRGAAGGARYRGTDAASAFSFAAAVPLELSLPVFSSSRVTASIVPGAGYGRIVGVDVVQGGVLPLIGASVGLTITSRFSVNLGVQRILLAGTPTQLGTALSWNFGNHGGLRP